MLKQIHLTYSDDQNNTRVARERDNGTGRCFESSIAD